MADKGMPPPELIPGYYDDRSGLAIFCVVFCLAVATIMVSLRVWTRKVIINKMGMDDWAAIVTLLITWGEGISIAVSTRYGLGRHIFAIQPPTLIPTYWKCFWVTLLLYCAGLFGAKMTFLLQYYRILAVQRMRIVYIVAIILVGAWSFAQVLIALLICRPIQGLWDKTIVADCMPNAPQIYVNAAGNIVTDVAIFLLPMPAIKHLNLRRVQKMMLFAIFSLGFFTVAISVIRIKFLDIKEDVTWQHVESSGWSIGELASALTCSSLPTLRPFVAKYFPSLGVTMATDDKPSSYRHGGATGGSSGGRQDSKGAFPSRATKRSASTGSGDDSILDKMEFELPIHHPGTTTTAEARGHSTDDNARLSITDEERLLGMRPTTTTEIHGSHPPHTPTPGPGSAIQVQKAVYQTSSMRQNRPGW